jgi:hypothetical protein
LISLQSASTSHARSSSVTHDEQRLAGEQPSHGFSQARAVAPFGVEAFESRESMTRRGWRTLAAHAIKLADVRITAHRRKRAPQDSMAAPRSD